ncbi:MAG: hypothetical protein GX372_07200 [Ignavibacteria bacterium]|jgi:hypothetical protein|nr:hypothetical protein [Ignavibacteria bacterium]
MKRLIIVLFSCIVLLPCFFSCSQNKEKNNQTEFTPGEVHIYASDKNLPKQKIVNNQEYNLVYVKEKSCLSENIYLDIRGYQFLSTNFYEKCIKLEQQDDSIFTCKFKLPENTASLTLQISGDNLKYNDLVDMPLAIPVYRNANDYEYGARYFLLEESDDTNYMKIFEEEREQYPDNITIYFAKWNKDKKKLTNEQFIDLIKADLEYLETNYSTNKELAFLQLAAYLALNDENKAKTAFHKIVETKSPQSLANELFAQLIDDYIGTLNLEEKDYINMMTKLMENNINSIWLQGRFHAGFFNRFHKKSAEYKETFAKLGIKIANANMNMQRNINDYKNYKANCLSHLLPDSLQALEEITAELKKAFVAKRSDLEGYDAFLHYKMKRNFLQSVLLEQAKANHKYQETISFLRDTLLKDIPEYDMFRGMTYDIISELFVEMKNLDSADAYIFKAYQMFPERVNIKKRLLKIHKENPNIDIDSKITELTAKYPIQQIKLTDFPEIELSDGSKKNINDVKTTKMILFSSVSCSPCHQLLKDIKAAKQKSNGNITIFVVTLDNIEELLKLDAYRNDYTFLVKNPHKLIQYLNVPFTTPSYFIISKDNELISKGGGYDKNAKLQFENLFSK